MANKSVKQQFYEQLANQHVQQALNNIGMQQFQGAYDQWNAEQDGLASFEAQYNEWANANPIEPQPVQTSAPASLPVLKAPDPVDFFKPRTASGTDINAQAAQDIDRRAFNEAYARQQQEEQALAGGLNDKRRQRQQSVNDFVNAINSNEFRDVVKQGQAAQLEPTSGMLTQDQRNAIARNVTPMQAAQWLSPEVKLTADEKEAARAYASSELQKFNYGPNRQPDLRTAEDRQHYADMVNLMNKTNTVANTLTGVMSQPYNLAKTIRDGVTSLGNQLGGLAAAIGDKIGLTQGATQRFNESRDAANQLAQQNDANMQIAKANAQTQNPVGYTAGQIGGQIGMYALTNPLFNSLGAAAGLGKAGSFALNQAGQNLQDIALDTLPTLNQYASDGQISDEERREILSGLGLNAAGNLIMGGVGEGLAALKNSRAARNAANEAFRANVSEGAERLARLANPEDIDNVVRNATRQTEEAAQNIENLGRQIQEVMPRQIDEAYDIPERLNPIAEMEDVLPSQLDDEIRAMNDEMGNMWGDTAAKNADNAAETVETAAKTQQPEIQNTSPENVKQFVDNPNLSSDVNADINDYLFPLEQPFTEKGKEAFRRVVNNITTNSEEGYNITAQYYEISDALRKTTDEATETALRGQLDDLRASAKNVDKSVRGQLKDALDYMDAETALADYKRALNGDNKEAVDAAARKLDAIRNRIARHKGTDKELSSMFSGGYGKAVKRPKNAYATPPETVDNDLVNGWIEYDNANTNRFVRDAVPDTALKSGAPGEVAQSANIDDIGKRSIVMAEDAGFEPEPDSYKLTSEYSSPAADTEAPKFRITEELDTPYNTKERGQSKHIRNAETPMRMEGVSEEVAADFEKDPDMYRVLRNVDTLEKAEDIYKNSQDPELAFRALLDKKDPAALPLGHQLAKDYSASGNHDAAAQIYRDMGKALTESGQFSQAAIINMVKNDPMTALRLAQKEIDALNVAGRQRFGDSWKDFELSKDEIEAFEKIKAGDNAAIKAAYEKIGDRLGKDYPVTMWDKLIEARRVAMLFNPRTNVRNLFANPPTMGMRWLSDRTEALGQNIAHLINPDIKVTQSLYGSGIKGRKLAKEALETPRVKALLNGAGSKADLPSLKSSLMTNKQVFKGTAAERWIDKVTNGGIQKANEVLFGKKGVQSIPETIRNATYKLLDLGDRPFIKENFVERLGSYIAATGAKNISDIPDEAIDLAWEEAMKATYKDNSWAVEMIRGLKKGMEKADNFIPGFGTALSQSTIPFVQAPGNIAARMVDYSPAGAGKGIARIISGARKSNVKAIEKGIEEAAKGLTGTGLIYLGMKLKESGILTGTYSSDKDQKAFEKMNGFKEFALHVGNNYFTYGWAQPFAQELMVGTLLQDAIDKSDEYDSDILRYYGVEGSDAGRAIGIAREGTKAAINSWFNESPLSGFADILKGNSYEKTDIAGNLWENGVGDFAGALIPSIVNATAKVADTTQRNTYNPDNSYASFLNANIAKLPGISKTLPAKYDTWGREMKYAESAGAAALARYAVPGEYSYDKEDDIDREVLRLFTEGVDSEGKLLQDNGVFPLVAPNKVGDKTLNNREVSTYQQDMGQRSRTAVETFMNSDAYKDIPDPEKVEILKNMYGASSAITKRDKFDSPLADNSNYKKAVAAYDDAGGGEKGAKALADYYVQKKIADESGLSSQSKAYEAIQKDLQSGNNKAAQQKIDEAKAITDAGINAHGYDAYQANKSRIPSLEKWTEAYTQIDSAGNSDGFVNQAEFLEWVKKNNYTESQAAQYAKIYGNWKQVPYLKKDGTWGFHKTK